MTIIAIWLREFTLLCWGITREITVTELQTLQKNRQQLSNYDVKVCRLLPSRNVCVASRQVISYRYRWTSHIFNVQLFSPEAKVAYCCCNFLILKNSCVTFFFFFLLICLELKARKEGEALFGSLSICRTSCTLQKPIFYSCKFLTVNILIYCFHIFITLKNSDLTL